MKSRTIRVLSIGGMLATVPAIAVISNTAGGSPVSASASSSSSPSSTPNSVSTASSAPASAPVVVVGTPVAGSATQFSYVVGDAATLVLDSAGGTLRVVTFAPHPGWFTIRLDQASPTDFQVLLESTGGQVRFTASVASGSVVTNLEVGSGPGNSVPGNSVPGNRPATHGQQPDRTTARPATPDLTTPDQTTARQATPPRATTTGATAAPAAAGTTVAAPAAADPTTETRLCQRVRPRRSCTLTQIGRAASGTMRSVIVGRDDDD